VTAAFLAGIVGHVTSRTYWISKNLNEITMISPCKGSLLAWGNNPNETDGDDAEK